MRSTGKSLSASKISQGAEPMAKEDSPIDTAFNDLDAELSEAFALFSALNVKLQPVQSAVCSESTDCDKRLSRGSSRVVQRIESASNQVSSLADSIRTLIRSLEV